MGLVVITGGAGFIGSYLHAELFLRGHQTVIVDWLGSAEKWRNLASHPPSRIVFPNTLEAFLAERPVVTAIFHLGAISETTAIDGDLVWSTNIALSNRLWEWCAQNSVRMIYASSAATYGNGSAGFDDDPVSLGALRPLNLYGWSKHVFDLTVMTNVQRGGPVPPQWVGLKFFNVYGPNEYHKGKMISVVKVKYDEIVSGKPVSLFRSCESGIADGAQQRDFIWVGDVVDVMLWFLEHPEVSGLFNLGTGNARTYLDLAYAVCDAAEVERRVEFVEMPKNLKGQYQSFTEAKMTRLREAGYSQDFTSLEAGIDLYIRQYLRSSTPFK